jgi:putative transposase
MKRRRHTPEQIIRKLREADRLLAEGREIPEVAKQLEISEATLSSLAGPVRRAEGRRRQAAQGTGGRERPTEADRGRQGAPDRSLEGAGQGKLVSLARPAPRRRAPPAGVRRVPAVGVPAGRAAPQHPTPPAGRAGPGPSPASRVAAAQPDASPLGLPPCPRRPTRAGLDGQPQGHPAAVARGRPAGASKASGT